MNYNSLEFMSNVRWDVQFDVNKYKQKEKIDFGLALDKIMEKAKVAEKKIDWTNITHYVVTIFTKNNNYSHERYMIPVSELRPEDKALASLQGSVSDEQLTLNDFIICQWLNDRIGVEWCYYHINMQSTEPHVTMGTFLEMYYYELEGVCWD